MWYSYFIFFNHNIHKEHLEKEVLSFEVAAKLARGTNTDERKEPSKMFYSPKEPKNDKINILKDTFEAINRDQDFSDCCERGRTEDIERIREILQKDPKKFITI